MNKIIYEVVVKDRNGCTYTNFFQWLSDAVLFATVTGGVLRNKFDSI
jgi:hypothetical protein